MKIHANVNITLDVSDEIANELLSEDNKTVFLKTIYGGNNNARSDLGKWYLDGKYSIENKFFGTIE